MGIVRFDDKDRILRLLLQRENTWNRYGNRKIFCGGIIMIGPIRSWWWLLEIWTLVVGAFFISEYEEYSYGIFIGGLAIFCISVLSCVLISFGDPGVLVKPTFSEACSNAQEVIKVLSSGLRSPYKTVKVGNKIVKYSYCMRCHHFRPPQTAHCHICDSCIVKWDHHCPVYGGCVGRKNLFAFHVMCMTQAVIWTYWLTCSAFAAANVVQEGAEPMEAIMRSKTLIGVGIGFLGAAILPAILSKTPLERDSCVPRPRSPSGKPLIEMTGDGDWTSRIPSEPYETKFSYRSSSRESDGASTASTSEVTTHSEKSSPSSTKGYANEKV